MAEPRCIVYDIVLQVTKRKYDVDSKALAMMLRQHRIGGGKSMDDIAFEMDVPKTLVEHWFRTDKYQAIPLPQYWHKLKEVLAIKSNEFDQQIMEWVTVDGVFEMANRCYDSRGLSPTIKACGDINVVVAE